MTPEMVGIILAGAGTLLGSIGTFTANRSRRTAADVKALAVRVRRLEKRDLAHSRHMYVLERKIVELGGDVPDRPAIIEGLIEQEDSDE